MRKRVIVDARIYSRSQRLDQPSAPAPFGVSQRRWIMRWETVMNQNAIYVFRPSAMAPSAITAR